METVFTYMAVIGGKLYSNHPKNLNHVHNDTKYLVYVIITVGVPTKILVVFYTRVLPMKIGEFYSTFNCMRCNSVVEWY